MAITIQTVIHKDRFTIEPGQVTAVKATGSGTATAPTVTGIRNGTVAAVKATGTGLSAPPALSGGSSTLASETFTGTSGAWPGQWTLGPTGTAVLTGNRGVLTPQNVAYQMTYSSLSGMSGITGNWNFKINIGFPTGAAECYHGISMSSTGTTSGTSNAFTAAGYSLVFISGDPTLNVQLYKNGVFADEGTFAFSSGVTVNVEWSRVGNVLTLWMWLSSGSKGTALITYTDSTSPVTGALKALLVAGNGATQQAASFDDLIITASGGASSGTVTAVVATGTGTARPPGGGGVAMPVGNMAGWTQVYAEDFLTPIALGNWESQAPALYGSATVPGLSWYGGPDTQEVNEPGFGGQYHANKTLSVTTAANANGVLDIYLHSENAAGGAPTSTDYTPYEAIVALVGFNGPEDWSGQVYGKWEWRFRCDTSADGWKVATMLWPDPGPWEDGEWDYPEGNFRENEFSIFVHDTLGTPQNNAYSVDPVPGSTFADWHVCGIEWDTTSLRFYLDGALVGSRAAGTNGYNAEPHRFTLQTETELGYNYDPGPPETFDPPPWNTSGHFQLDWLVQYSKT